MRAVVLRRPGPPGSAVLDYCEVAAAAPAEGELQLEVAACAVCRTDLQIVEGDLTARRLPIIPGHQAVGRVVAIGAGVEGWALGDRAGVAWLASTCEACRYCKNGRGNLCESAQFTGWDRDGGFAGRVTVRADFALRVPDGFDDLAAAPLLCGGVIGYRSLKVSGIEPGGRLGLYGFGASAGQAIQVAVYRGCRVFVCTRSEAEQRRAISLGAEWAGGYDSLPPERLDAAITFAPAGDVVVAALRALAPGGTVAINAIHLDRVPEFSYDLLWRERAVRSVANFTRADAQEYLDLAARIPIRTTVEVAALGEAGDVLRRLREGAISGAAVLVP
ncbi:MAG: zinc-dependent alcohol dehydrogenase family protein [Chloroflexi bacterium]|nr:zinc-dependent alcohol dehydrogenase family protein [Chloroflexota bacterium]